MQSPFDFDTASFGSYLYFFSLAFFFVHRTLDPILSVSLTHSQEEVSTAWTLVGAPFTLGRLRLFDPLLGFGVCVARGARASAHAPGHFARISALAHSHEEVSAVRTCVGAPFTLGRFQPFVPVAGLWSLCRPGSTGILSKHLGLLFSMEPHCALAHSLKGGFGCSTFLGALFTSGRLRLFDPLLGFRVCAALDARASPTRRGTLLAAGWLVGVSGSRRFSTAGTTTIFGAASGSSLLRCPRLSTRAVPPPRQLPVRSSPRSTSPPKLPKTLENFRQYSVTAGLMAFCNCFSVVAHV